MKILYKPHTTIFCITPDMLTGYEVELLMKSSEKECLMAESILKKVRKQAAIELWARYELKPMDMICEPVAYTRESQMDFINTEAGWSSGTRMLYAPPTITVTYYIKAVIAKGQRNINLLKLKDPDYLKDYRIEDCDDIKN